MIVRVYSNVELTAANFSDLETNVSPIQTDTLASTLTGGRLLYSLALGANASQIIDLSTDQLAGQIEIGDSITISAETISGTGATCVLGINWTEEQ